MVMKMLPGELLPLMEVCLRVEGIDIDVVGKSLLPGWVRAEGEEAGDVP